mmetsp:Transcript_28602/g.85452  ORF Transcript_28602/g.85452 Transcript_28602/m.85452 type:complete len:181 (+) Transcript_28602:156-698(+)
MRTLALLLCALRAAALEEIFSAVRADDGERVEKSIKEDPSGLNRKGPGGQTPLMHAVLQGKEDAVIALLALGADLTIPEKDGYTPMHGAGFQGREKIARLLFAAGVPLDEKHADGHAPLHRACWGNDKRHADTVRAMLEMGAFLGNRDQCRTSNERTKKVLKRFFEHGREGIRKDAGWDL